MPDSELNERLRESRDAWITAQTQEVLSGLLPSGEHPRAYRLLAGQASGEDLTTATLLTRIAVDDAEARSPQAIAEWIIAAGLVNAEVSAGKVADELVYPTVQRLRQFGVPWSRWWDMRGLHSLFVELWTARQLVMSPPDIMSHELQTIWQFSEHTATAVLANAPDADPYSLFPPDLFETFKTGEVTELLREMAPSWKLRPDVEELLARYLPELADHPDLIEVVRRVHHYRDLKYAARKSEQVVGRREVTHLQDDLATWDDQLRRFLSKLTAYELELIREPATSTAYRDQCLTAGRRVWVPSLLGMHALPTPSDVDEPPQPPPPWMQDTLSVRLV